jgi:acyl-coenzyme A thioesterase PaaI-like protein
MAADQYGDAAFSNVAEFLGGPTRCADDAWSFEFGPHLDSSWGGTYGGALAAAVLTVARALTPGRSPRSLHLQMMRQVGLGGARATGVVLHQGRTVTTVEVRLLERNGKPAVHGLVTLVDPVVLARNLDFSTTEPVEIRRAPLDENAYAVTPIVTTLRMPTAHELWEVADAPPHITGRASCASPVVTPWRERDHTGPELACVVADLCNGAAIVSALPPQDQAIAFPNSDLSLRFIAEHAPPEAIGVGALLGVRDGTTIVDIRVQAGHRQLGHGLSGSILMPMAPADAPAARFERASPAP